MKKIIKSFLKFLEGKGGERSSKRLIFVGSAIQLSLMVGSTLGWFLYKKEYDLAIDLIKAFGGAVLIMGGFVATEVFKKK